MEGVLVRRHFAFDPRTGGHDRARRWQVSRDDLSRLDVPDQRHRRMVVSYWARQMPGFWWVADFGSAGGPCRPRLLARPMQGVLTLTIVVGAYFLAEVSPPSCRAGAPARVVRALVVDAGRRQHGHHHRRLDHRRPAGIGGMGDRAFWPGSTCCSAAPR